MKTTLVGKTPNLINFFKSHNHECWEIVIPTTGNGIVETDREKVDFSVGSAYVIPPNIFHTTYSDNEFSDIYIHIDSLNLNKDSITTIYGIKELASLGNIIHDAYLKWNQGYSEILNNALKLLVQMIYDLSFVDPHKKITGEIRNFLADNISHKDISMNTLAEKFGYNGDYIRRIFKKDFELTPMEYLDNLRLSHAKELLSKMPIYTIEEIGELCGFADRFYFSRFFKKHTGISPQNFRKSNNT